MVTWSEKSIGDLFLLSGGRAASRADLSNRGYFYLHYGDIHASTKPYIDTNTDSGSLPRLNISLSDVSVTSLLQDGDIVFVNASEDDTGVSKHVVIRNVYNIAFIAGLHTIVAKPLTEEIENAFREYCFQATGVRAQFKRYAAGTKVVGINKANIKKIIIQFPKSFTEQRAIATALSDTDNLVASLQKLIAKKKAIKQGAMQELLAGIRRLPGFHKKWLTKSFEELFCINGGISASREKLGSKGFCYLHYGDIHGSSKQYVDIESDFSNIPKIYTQIKTLNKKSLLKDGDIVFVDASEDDEGTYKHIVVRNKSNILFIAGLHTIICNSKTRDIDNRYKEYCFCSPAIREQILFYAAGTKVKGINKTNIAKLILQFPQDLEEQAAIAQILSDMDTEIEQLEKKLSKYQQIKQGMMQELLTGRIRLITTEPEQKQFVPAKKHNQQFDDAVMIAGIVDAFYSETYPLGRKKVQKLLYLARRREEADVSAFHKKAAGPYADAVRYKGGEPIAKKSKYVAAETSAKGTMFSRGANIEQALGYIQSWGKQEHIEWLIANFQRTKVDDLELFATVDMAMCDLRKLNKPVSVETIKELIQSTEEWREKLNKLYFSDQDIQRAINKCREFFGEQ